MYSIVGRVLLVSSSYKSNSSKRESTTVHHPSDRQRNNQLFAYGGACPVIPRQILYTVSGSRYVLQRRRSPDALLSLVTVRMGSAKLIIIHYYRSEEGQCTHYWSLYTWGAGDGGNGGDGAARGSGPREKLTNPKP